MSDCHVEGCETRVHIWRATGLIAIVLVVFAARDAVTNYIIMREFRRIESKLSTPEAP